MKSKLAAQVARFARLFGFAFATQVVADGTSHLTVTLIISAVVGALEAAWRQFAAPPDTAG